MQPYFLPYLGYFDLIRNSDRWIVFDTAQYIRHGWVNRNRILHPNEGWQYIGVPIRKHGLRTPINEIEINNSLPWREKIIGQLAHYRRHAPHYEAALGVIRECLIIETDLLGELNVHALSVICSYLRIPFEPEIFSRMDLRLGEIRSPGDWALEISKSMGATEYINPPGGREIFVRENFFRANIALNIRDVAPIEYSCRGYKFEPRLSIVDTMMWVSREKIADYLLGM